VWYDERIYFLAAECPNDCELDLDVLDAYVPQTLAPIPEDFEPFYSKF